MRLMGPLVIVGMVAGCGGSPRAVPRERIVSCRPSVPVPLEPSVASDAPTQPEDDVLTEQVVEDFREQCAELDQTYNDVRKAAQDLVSALEYES